MKDKVERALGEMEGRYANDGIKPIRWQPRKKAGCRSCGDREKGPWTVSLMSSLVPERGEALIFIVTFCRRFLGDEDRRDDVAEEAVSEYLARKERK